MGSLTGVAPGAVFSGAPAAGTPAGKGTDAYRTASPLGDVTLGKYGISATPSDTAAMFSNLFSAGGAGVLAGAGDVRAAGTGALPFDLQALLGTFGKTDATNTLATQGADLSGIGADLASAFKGFDVGAFTKEQYDLMEKVMGGTDATAANSLANRLFSSGRLGANDTTAGGAFGQLAASQDAAKANRMLQAFGMANTEQMNLGSLSNMFTNAGMGVQQGAQGMEAGNMANFTGAASGIRGDQAAQNNNIMSMFNMGTAAENGANNALSPLQQAIQNVFNTQTAGINAYQARKAGESSNTNPLMSAFSGFIGGAGQGVGTALGSKI